eukprot:2646306-Pyramimonas_sp.AAC.1
MANGTRSGPGYQKRLPSSARAVAAPSRAARARRSSGQVEEAAGTQTSTYARWAFWSLKTTSKRARSFCSSPSTSTTRSHFGTNCS